MRLTLKQTATWLLAAALSVPALAGEASGGKDGFKLGEGTDFTLEAHFLLQVRGTMTTPETEFTGDLYAWTNDRDEVDDVVDTELPSQGSFRMRRVRAIFNGKVYKPWLTYKLETELYGDRTSPRLLDGYVRVGQDSGFWGQVGQFKPPYDIFFLAAPWKLQFGDLSVASNETPKWDLGWLVGWRSASGRWLARMAQQNGVGTNEPDADDGKLTTVRLEFQSAAGFGDERSAIAHNDEVIYTVGLGLQDNQAGGLIDEETGGTCLVGTSRECSYDTRSRRGLELFGALRTRDLAITGSYQKLLIEDGLLADIDGTLADRKKTVVGIDAGWFAFDEKLELIGRYALSRDEDSGFVSPGIGPDGISDPTVKPSAPPNLVLDSERIRQWGVGFNYYIQEHNVKVHFSWTQTELRNDVRDQLQIYVPDLNLGNPAVTFGQLKEREGRIYRRSPVWAAMLTFYI